MANKAGVADQKRTTDFDHAKTLPRKASLGDDTVCRMYFLAGAGLVKIGVSTNITSRIRAIRNSSPVPLELWATMPSCLFREMRLHSDFKHLRRHGEWFEDDGSIRAYVERKIAEGKAQR